MAAGRGGPGQHGTVCSAFGEAAARSPPPAAAGIAARLLGATPWHADYNCSELRELDAARASCFPMRWPGRGAGQLLWPATGMLLAPRMSQELQSYTKMQYIPPMKWSLQACAPMAARLPR